MKKRSHAVLAVTAGLMTSLCFLAPQAFADGGFASVSEPAVEASSVSTVAKPQVDAASANESGTPVASSAESAATAPSSAPVDASASAGARNGASVAEFNGTPYATFDEALAAAKNTNGATIKLLGDAETSGLDLHKDLTIDGNGHALKFTQKKGIALWGKALTFKNVNVTMTGIGSTPYTAEWNWMSVCASKDASLTLDGATLTMDGTGTASNVHAIYFCSNNKLNLKNGSNLTIKNYSQDALEWDGGDGGYNVNIEGGSTYISDHNRSGFTGTFYATIDSSTVKVLNSKGNGSNGTYYTIKNGSEVTFDNSGTWGISAWRIDMSKGSKLYANDNGYSGIWTRVLNVDSSCLVDVEGNGTKGPAAKNGGIFFQGNKQYTSVIEKGANVTIKNNAGSGIYTEQDVCNLTIGSATITNNGTGACNKDGIGADMGGGVYNVGTMRLDSSVVIYNNHAANAGDDIYSTSAGDTDFGNVGTGWILDDCDHTIDGWYVDGKDSRWSAHGEAKYVEAAQPGTYEAKEAPVAFKAAHGLVSVSYQYVGEAPEKAKLPDADEGLEVGSAYAAKEQKAVDGWTFDGWYTDEGCTVLWNDGDSLTGSMTLYGKWTKKPVQPSEKPKTEIAKKTKSTKSTKSLPSTGDKSSAVMTAALAGVGTAVLGFGEAIRRRANSNR
ncbi:MULTISPECIES: InlB B-repeat-containing protein [unclassified Collinsella]|uniref:InlB B-repeat-containing protein n=1 Tax=unclassified Collinsella TaxID=2637548 RepID=UPI003F93B11C